MSSEQRSGGDRPTQQGADEAKLFFGRLLGVLGLVTLPLGALFVSVAMDAVALCLGVAGYFLGARRLGLVVVALSVLAAILGMLIGQGYIPNILDWDGAADGLRRGMEALTGG